jgi:hypothetical protein
MVLLMRRGILEAIEELFDKAGLWTQTYLLGE